ncbi:hypothetical protein [Nostoc paludosum]
MLSASLDNTLKLWNLETGKCVLSWTGDAALTCCAIACSEDNLTVIVGSLSGHVNFLRLTKSQ